MIETFCILSMLFMLGYLVSEAARGIGRKVSSLTAGHSGCSVTCPNDGNGFSLSYIGPDYHMEYGRVKFGSARNDITSLTYDGKAFKAVAVRRKTVTGPVLEEITFEARTIRELAATIEEQFRKWTVSDGWYWAKA